jgi:hypothetical protein
MNGTQVAALAGFERYYAELDLALDAEDCDAIARLVEERADALSALVSAFAGELLPDHLRQRVELSESRIRGRIAALHAALMRDLGDTRRRQTASARYAEAMR